MLKLPFKKLNIWIKSIELTQEIYAITKTFPKEELYGLISQIRRSAVSVASNIAEGSQRTTNKDFSNFLSIARGSLAELETQLIISTKLKYLTENQLDKLSISINEISKMTYSFQKKLTTNL